MPANTCKSTRQKIEKSKTLRERWRVKKKKIRHIPTWEKKRRSTQNMQLKTPLENQWKLMSIDLPFSSVYVVCVSSLSLFGLSCSISHVFVSSTCFNFWIVQLLQTARRYPNPTPKAKLLPVRFLQSTCHSLTTSCSPQSGLKSHVTISSRRSNSGSGQAQHTQVATNRKSAWRRIATSTSPKYPWVRVNVLLPKIAQGNALWGPQNQWSEKHARNFYGCKGPPQYFVSNHACVALLWEASYITTSPTMIIMIHI